MSNAQVYGTLCLGFITPEEFTRIETICSLSLEDLPQELRTVLDDFDMEGLEDKSFEVTYNKNTRCVYLTLDEELGNASVMAVYCRLILQRLHKKEAYAFQWAVVEGNEAEVGVCSISKDHCTVIYGSDMLSQSPK